MASTQSGDAEMKRVAAVLVGASALVGVAQANLVLGFEGSTGGWSAGANWSATLTNSFGVTQGAQALEISSPSNFMWNQFDLSGMGGLFVGMSTLSFDVTLPTEFGGAWGSVAVAFNSQGSGWKQFAQHQDLQLGTTSPQTLSWNLTSLNYDFANVGSWFQLQLGFNSSSGTPVKFYLDNVQAVPEPATLLALGAGAALLLRRRKS